MHYEPVEIQRGECAARRIQHAHRSKGRPCAHFVLDELWEQGAIAVHEMVVDTCSVFPGLVAVPFLNLAVSIGQYLVVNDVVVDVSIFKHPFPVVVGAAANLVSELTETWMMVTEFSTRIGLRIGGRVKAFNDIGEYQVLTCLLFRSSVVDSTLSILHELGRATTSIELV